PGRNGRRDGYAASSARAVCSRADDVCVEGSKSMAIIGYAAALEQFHPTELLNYSILAEQYGFKGVMAADHFQPWVPQQGHNAFVWAWMAALGQATKTLTFGPGVNCPSFRY